MSLELYVALIAVFRLGLVAVVPDPSASRAHVAAALVAICRSPGFIGGRKAHLLRLLHAPLRATRWAVSLDGWLPAARSWSASQRARSRSPHRGGGARRTGPRHLHQRQHQRAQGGGAIARIPARAARRPGAHACTCVPATSTCPRLPVFVLANLASGVTSVLPDADLRMPGQIDAAPVIAQMTRHQVTRIAASPGLVGRLVEASARTRTPLPLAIVHVGGAPVFPPSARRHRLGGAGRPASSRSTDRPRPSRSPRSTALDVVGRRPARMRQGRGLLTGRPVPEIARAHAGRAVDARSRWARSPAPSSTRASAPVGAARRDRRQRRARPARLLSAAAATRKRSSASMAGLASHRRRRVSGRRRTAVAARTLPGARRRRARRPLSVLGGVRRDALRTAWSAPPSRSIAAPGCCCVQAVPGQPPRPVAGRRRTRLGAAGRDPRVPGDPGRPSPQRQGRLHGAAAGCWRRAHPPPRL